MLIFRVCVYCQGPAWGIQHGSHDVDVDVDVTCRLMASSPRDLIKYLP